MYSWQVQKGFKFSSTVLTSEQGQSELIVQPEDRQAEEKSRGKTANITEHLLLPGTVCTLYMCRLLQLHHSAINRCISK